LANDFSNPLTTFLSAVTAATVSPVYRRDNKEPITIQGYVAGTGAVTAAFQIKGGNREDMVNVPLATITLSGTTSVSDGFLLTAPYKFIQIELSSISGTNAAATATAGT